MAKYLVDTFYTCTLKVTHFLDNISEKELENLEKREDGKFEILDIKIDKRKTKNLEKNNNSTTNTLSSIAVNSSGVLMFLSSSFIADTSDFSFSSVIPETLLSRY